MADVDVIPGLSPFPNYSHMGTEVLIDGLGSTGTLIVSPSYVEKSLIEKTKSSVAAHVLEAYSNGLVNAKAVAMGEEISNKTIHENLKQKNDLDMDSKIRSVDVMGFQIKVPGLLSDIFVKSNS